MATTLTTKVRRIQIQARGWQVLQMWRTWTQVQRVSVEETHQHGRLRGRRRSTDGDWTERFWLCRRRWRGSQLRSPVVAMQPKEPWHYTKTSDFFLLKVFDKEQGVPSHHRQRQLRKHRLYCIGELFEIKDRAKTPHPYTIGWIKKDPCIKVTNFVKSLFQLVSFIKIQWSTMLLIWMHVTYYWDDSATWRRYYPSR